MSGRGGPHRAARRAGPIALPALLALAFAIALGTSSGSASPGWDLVLDRPTPQFGGLDFVSADEGWLTAGAGVLHTTDGGISWQEAAKLTASDVDFADAAHGWLVGLSGSIYNTSDGGQTWATQPSGTDVHLRDIFAMSPTEAFAVGNGAGFSDALDPEPPTALLHTTNGGASWQSIGTPVDTWFEEIEFVGANGWVLGRSCYTIDGSPCTVLMRTTDGGANWFSQDNDLPGYVSSIAFTSAMEGWATTQSCIDDVSCPYAIFHTTDGGATWDPSHLSSDPLLDLAFADASSGWALSTDCSESGCSLIILEKAQAGTTWSALAAYALDTEQYPTALSVASGELFATGTHLVLRSGDGGDTWTEGSHPALQLGSVDFVESDAGFAVDGSVVLRTVDAGRSWERVRDSPVPFPRVAFTSQADGFLIGARCPPGGCSILIYRTADGGATWSQVHSAVLDVVGSVVDLQFIDAQRGWAVTSGGVAVTADGGTTWEQHLLLDGDAFITYADLADANNGWAIASSFETFTQSLYHTTDGGVTWTAHGAVAGENFEHLDFADAGHGWYTGHVCDELTCRPDLFHTVDGGTTWQQTDLGDDIEIHDLAYVDSLNGWLSASRCDAVSCRSLILHSADGGQTWGEQLAEDGALLIGGFDFVDVKTGWFLLDARRGQGLGGGPPQRTQLYHTTDGGGGPIGVTPTPTPTRVLLPDVGSGPTDSGGPILPALVLAIASAAALATGAGLAYRRGVR